MSVHPESSGTIEEVEVNRLVSLARQAGEPDKYSGKRGWERYSLGIGLEITTDPDDPSAAWPAVMHNVSGGGFGFWSRRPLRGQASIHIRERTDNYDAPWLPARVIYCHVGIKGYLVGTALDHPIASRGAADAPAVAVDDRPAPQPGPARQPAPLFSLRSKCAIVAALTCCGGVVAAVLLSQHVWTNAWPAWVALVAVTGAYA